MTEDQKQRYKIGIVTFISAICFILAVLFIGRFSLKPRREVTVHFSFINSLEVRAPVRFAGARVGEVKSIHVLTAEERTNFPKNPPYVYVIAAIDKEIGIPKGTKAMVNTMGFMGEKYLELIPETRSTVYIQDNDFLEGVDPTPMDTVFASAKKLADEMQVVAKNMNTLTTELQDRLPVLFGEIEKTLVSAKELAGDAKHLTADVQKFVDVNRENFNHLLANGRQITIYMKSFSHVLATRPWKLVWGFGGPLKVEPEDEVFVPEGKMTRIRAEDVRELDEIESAEADKANVEKSK
jgi:phospholipid/cholesterol/gamma-HCH transport system substrate-binding protein